MLEGDYIDKSLLQVDEKQYIPWNLEEKIRIDQKFDLAISLEVAEHLSECRASSFCEDLTLLSNVILFAAAIPYQGGTGHINEQPMSYWVDKFSAFNYEAFDIIRPLIQSDKDIMFWYRQNIIVFVKKKSLEYEQFILKKQNLPPLDMVSYDVYMSIQKKIRALPVFKLYQFLRRIK